MRRIDFSLNNSTQSTGEKYLNENEPHILLAISRFPNRKTVFYTLDNGRGSMEKIPSTHSFFERIEVSEYNKLTVDGNFRDREAVNGAIFLGTWAEILITDIELNLDQLFQSASSNKIAFRIGMENMANLIVESDSLGNFHLKHTLVIQTGYATKQDVIKAGSDSAEKLKEIYRRVCTNLNDLNFNNAQSAQTHRMQQNAFDLLKNY